MAAGDNNTTESERKREREAAGLAWEKPAERWRAKKEKMGRNGMKDGGI